MGDSLSYLDNLLSPAILVLRLRKAQSGNPQD